MGEEAPVDAVRRGLRRTRRRGRGSRGGSVPRRRPDGVPGGRTVPGSSPSGGNPSERYRKGTYAAPSGGAVEGQVRRAQRATLGTNFPRLAPAKRSGRPPRRVGCVPRTGGSAAITGDHP